MEKAALAIQFVVETLLCSICEVAAGFWHIVGEPIDFCGSKEAHKAPYQLLNSHRPSRSRYRRSICAMTFITSLIRR